MEFIKISLDSAAAHQMLEDEKFALMLQNEEFMAELRGNHEFLSTLEEDHSADDQERSCDYKAYKYGKHMSHMYSYFSLFTSHLVQLFTH